MGIIYIIKNSINGKVYVGKTILTLEDRIKKHMSTRLRPRQVIQKAILKYGKDSFSWSVLENVFGLNINEREIYWINKMNSTNPLIGYNRAIGGEGGRKSFLDSVETRKLKSIGMLGNMNGKTRHQGYRHTKEHRLKISEKMRGKNKRPKSTEWKIKLSESLKEYRMNNPMTSEHKEKISAGVKLANEMGTKVILLHG